MMSANKPPSIPVADEFSPSDVERILAETFIERVDYHDTIESTNSRALQLAGDDSDSETCTLVLADRQTDGRGRGANRWWSAGGALTFSVLLKPDLIRLPTHRWPQVSLTTGLAVCEAIEILPGTAPLRLKWPNDVFLGDRKLCGILVEATDGRRRSLVIGVGVNVNNSMSQAPAALRDTAIALCETPVQPLRRADVLRTILQQLTKGLERLTAGTESLHEQWHQRCMLTGRRVQIERPLHQLVGICRGIDSEGALLLETDGGIERCVSGVISQIDGVVR